VLARCASIEVKRKRCFRVDVQLGVDEIHAHNVCEDDDGILGALVFGVGEVGSNCLDQYGATAWVGIELFGSGYKARRKSKTSGDYYGVTHAETPLDELCRCVFALQPQELLKGIVLLSIVFTSPLAVPSCLTPMAQHCAGG
jgi:hypothetical protein